MTQPTSAQKTMNEQDDTSVDISIPLLKEVAKHLHLAVAAYRKSIKGNNKDKGSGKKRKDFKFKHRIVKTFGCRGHITIRRWIQEQKTYATNPLCHIYYDGKNDPNVLAMRTRLARETTILSVDIADPKSFDKLANELIRLLDWRG